jgi:TolB-like protein/Tfp pilus assembly protein PilF
VDAGLRGRGLWGYRDEASPVNSLFGELRRRKVLNVGAAYVLVAWLAVQAASIVFPAFDAPPWALRMFILASFLGFPLALLFAWAFDLTNDGVKAEVGLRGNTLVIVAAAGLAALSLAWYFKGQPAYRAGERLPPPAAALGPSVAVLPFANLSGRAEEEYFSDGMTEELLNVLARIPNLKVAARTSVFAFKGKQGDARAIGNELGVSHIVAGSVRREGSQVRISAQLVRVSDGLGVWSESYDRELRNVFALQDEIAGRIAQKMRQSLEPTPIANKRAVIDPAAYDAYLKGRDLYRRRSNILQAVTEFESAVAKAPGFAAAWANLALAQETSYYFTTPAERAPLGDFYERTAEAAAHAGELDPNSAMSLHALANVARRDLHYAEADILYRRAIAADPTYPDVREDYSELLLNVGRFDDALREIRQLVALEPRAIAFWWRFNAVGAYADRADLVKEGTAQMRALNPDFTGSRLAKFLREAWHARLASAGAALAAAARHSPGAASDPELQLYRWAVGRSSMDAATARAAMLTKPTYSYIAAAAGDSDLFFDIFEHPDSRAQRYYFWFYASMPVARKQLADPRAKRLLHKLGFVAYWREQGWPPLCRARGADDFECGPAADAP